MDKYRKEFIKKLIHDFNPYNIEDYKYDETSLFLSDFVHVLYQNDLFVEDVGEYDKLKKFFQFIYNLYIGGDLETEQIKVEDNLMEWFEKLKKHQPYIGNRR